VLSSNCHKPLTSHLFYGEKRSRNEIDRCLIPIIGLTTLISFAAFIFWILCEENKKTVRYKNRTIFGKRCHVNQCWPQWSFPTRKKMCDSIDGSFTVVWMNKNRISQRTQDNVKKNIEKWRKNYVSRGSLDCVEYSLAFINLSS